MNTDLETRFPTTYALCKQQFIYIRYNPVTQNGVTYNKNSIPTLKQYQINDFIKLQNKYPEVINECFNCLIESLEQAEKRYVTGENNEEQTNRPMDKIYKLLTDLQLKETQVCDMMFIDNWVLFIKSQNEFSKFF